MIFCHLWYMYISNLWLFAIKSWKGLPSVKKKQSNQMKLSKWALPKGSIRCRKPWLKQTMNVVEIDSLFASAHIAALPTSSIIIWRTNHEDRIPLTFPNGSPFWAVFVFIGAVSIFWMRWCLFPTYGSDVEEFGGAPHFTFKNRMPHMAAALVRRCIRLDIEEQNGIPFNGSQQIIVVIGKRPNLALKSSSFKLQDSRIDWTSHILTPNKFRPPHTQLKTGKR